MDPLKLLDFYRQYSTSLADIQSQENNAKIDYQSALDTIRKRRRQDVSSLAQNAADRGMVHSGANLKSNMDLQEGYNEQTATLGSKHNAMLAGLAKRKLQEEADFNQAKFLLGAAR